MSGARAALARACADWELSAPRSVARTPRASLWKVTRRDGSEAALKLVRPEGMQSEGHQGALLAAWQGEGAALVHRHDAGRILIEWLDAPSLGDLARGGDDAAASRALAAVARRLGQASRHAALIPLENYMADLFAADPGRVPAGAGAALAAAQTMGRKLLATAPANAVLHGDLHHDNVLQGPRGWTSIDPKGLWGDPHFELANSFRNPLGMEAEAAAPALITARAVIFAAGTGLDPGRLVAWAAVQAALSMCWDGRFGQPDNPDMPLLTILLRMND